MLTEVISKLDRAVLELALVDAFTDMCFYEGEEFIAELEKYLEDIDNKTNTEEQDNVFFETSMPYIEHSVMKYGTEIYEGLKWGGPDDPANTKGEGLVGAEVTKIVNKKARDKYLTKAGLNVPTTAKKTLTEAEEAEIWEGVGQIIYPAIKEGIAKAKTALVKTGKSLSDAAQSGILAAQKKLQKFLTDTKIAGKPAVTAPQEKV